MDASGLSIGEKIRLIRESTGEGRTLFARRIGITQDALTKIENGKQRAREDAIENVAKLWPEYAYWLVTGRTDPGAGHISPAIESKTEDLDERGMAG